MNELILPLFFIIRDFLLTILIEVIVGFIFKLRKKEELLTLIGVNLITNPLVNSLFLLRIIPFQIPLIILVETIVIIVEAKMLSKVLNKKINQMLLLSLAINITSFGAGIILFWK